MNFNILYNIIDYSIVVIYGLTFAFIFIRALHFIEEKVYMEDYNEPFGYYEVATPPIPQPESQPDPLIEAIAIQPSSTANYSSLHISKLRVLAGVPSNSKLTKKELIAILND